MLQQRSECPLGSRVFPKRNLLRRGAQRFVDSQLKQNKTYQLPNFIILRAPGGKGWRRTRRARVARLAERWVRAAQNLKGTTEAPILPDLRFVAYRHSLVLVADGAPAVGQEELNKERGAVAYPGAKKSVNIWDHAVNSSNYCI